MWDTSSVGDDVEEEVGEARRGRGMEGWSPALATCPPIPPTFEGEARGVCSTSMSRKDREGSSRARP